MDPIAQLGKDAYHALCIAFAAQSKDKLYSPETDVLLEDARDLLGVTEEEDRAIRASIDQDPMIAALRRGEMPPGGIRPLLLPSSRSGTPYAGMPPPAAAAAATAAPAGGTGGFDTPFSTQQKAAAKKTAATPNSAASAPPAATTAAAAGAPPPGATGSALVGRKLQRLIPDLSPPWVTGTVMSYNSGTGRHLIQWGPPLRRESWECIADFAPQNFRWLEPGPEPASATAGGAAKTGGGSKSTPKASTPKAPPPPPAPKAPPATPITPASGPLLPGGPSTHHATGVSLTSAPYNESFLRSCLAKNRPEDLSIMLSAIDERDGAIVRELVALLEDPGDIAEINRLLEESQQLASREQQLRADLRELGVMG
ncbi:hypothetical protein Vretimale_17756 [Volvox reticuliferus]|uniref:ENT domain-containing protein n=1 Tax=Volvox reticuliferus TaxID=1737510 RepID=A0A8J4LXI5_9CHLO|nr:hypothetical protein Vretifemale_18994 [Volvox reticuliferus]GIM14887.1 hypothetical protein Vretimale_17756 [Volvox reticuliferus]